MTGLRRVVVTGLVAASACACAGGAGAPPTAAPPPPVTPTAALPPAAAPTPALSPSARRSPAPDRVLLALRDNGRTVAVTRATRITLSLPDSHRWSAPELTGARATAVEVVSDAPAGGQAFEVTVHETGRSTLRSTGRPACAEGPGCPATDLSYEVVLDVRG